MEEDVVGALEIRNTLSEVLQIEGLDLFHGRSPPGGLLPLRVCWPSESGAGHILLAQHLPSYWFNWESFLDLEGYEWFAVGVSILVVNQQQNRPTYCL